MARSAFTEGFFNFHPVNVSPRGCTTEPVEPLLGFNKDAWGIKTSVNDCLSLSCSYAVPVFITYRRCNTTASCSFLMESTCNLPLDSQPTFSHHSSRSPTHPLIRATHDITAVMKKNACNSAALAR